MYDLLLTKIDQFTIAQLETLIWAVSKRNQAQFAENIDLVKKASLAVIDRVRIKAPSMKARGVAFAIEAIANINVEENSESEELLKQVFSRLEKVVITKIDEFIPHYLIKILVSYTQIGLGSGELFDSVISAVIKAMPNEVEGSIKYSDMIRFFEVFPNVSYIYDHTMTSELYKLFMNRILKVVNNSKFPTEDLCRVFNILVKISPHSQFNDL